MRSTKAVLIFLCGFLLLACIGKITSPADAAVGSSAVQGFAAANSTVRGNPVYIGGVGDAAVAAGFVLGTRNAGFSAAAATTTKWVDGVAGQHIYVTSLTMSQSATGTVSFLSGTGATCGTGTVVLNGALTMVATSTPLTIGSGAGIVLKTVALGDSICITTTGVGAVANGWGVISQF